MAVALKCESYAPSIGIGVIRRANGEDVVAVFYQAFVRIEDCYLSFLYSGSCRSAETEISYQLFSLEM